MSSLFNIAAGGQAGDFYGYQIENSLRFDGTDSSLTRTPSSAGNTQIFTWSGWAKRSALDNGVLFGVRTALTSRTTFRFGSTNIDFFDDQFNLRLTSANLLRDVSAWYHVMVAVDTTQATSSDRVKIYVNGEQITSFVTTNYPSQNYSTQINTTNVHAVGKEGETSTNPYNGYLAEVNFIDGQQLDPTSFGETKSGVWIPKDTSGLTFGTNGFRLEFGDSAAIGDDTSGNGNDFTANNLQAIDVTLDSPTNNFATLNPLIKASTYGLAADPAPTNGNLDIAMAGGTNNIAVSTFELQAPNKYRCSFELTSRGSSTNFELGICNANETLSNGQVYYNSSGFIANESATQQSGLTSANTVGDIVEILVDLDANNVKFALKENGSSTWAALGTAESITANLTNPIVWVREQGSSNINGKFDFGQLGYVGSDDENYFPMSTANLPEPSITPLNDDIPEDYFDTVLYTGNGTSGHVIDGIQTNPDFTWIKDRNVAKAHMLFDSLRGDGTNLYPLSSDSTGAERTDLSRLILGDGQFEIDVTESSVNANNQSYVAWNWQAGGTAVSNTDGSITSSVSANTEAGFSIVSYTGNGTAGATIGHGLDKAPELLINKNRDEAQVFQVNADVIGKSYVMSFTTAARLSRPNQYYYNWDSSVITTGSDVHSNGNADKIIAYCFHSVEGYSKIGSYTGNGSTDGTFVYTGFRPAWVMHKRTDSTSDWFMFDNRRLGYNSENHRLVANSTATEADPGEYDILSNGFKIRFTSANVNASGGTYIYMAFAEMPFKYANAR